MAEKCSFLPFSVGMQSKCDIKILKSENHWYDICNDWEYKVWSLKRKYELKALADLKLKAA